MKLGICRRNYEYKKWFAWYPVYWDYEGGKWIWLEFVYRKWSAWDKMWVIITKDQYDQAMRVNEGKKINYYQHIPRGGMGRGRGFCGDKNC